MTTTGRPFRVGIIGAGRIGSLLARAIARWQPAVALAVASRNRGSCEDLRREIPGLAIAERDILAGEVDMLLLAVPAEAYLDLLGNLAGALAPDCIVVSLTNGIALDEIGELVCNPIVKVVPTMAHLVARGTSLVISGPHAQDRHIARTVELFSAFSRPTLVDDRDARVASNVAGTFLALAAAFTDAFVGENSGRSLTLDRTRLEAMAAEALGAVSALVAAGYSLTDIAATTATPGGPTQAALSALEPLARTAAAAMVDATFRNQAEQRGAVGRGRRPDDCGSSRA